MTRKSALQKIEDHEKLCRIMQKQTFDQIKEVKQRLRTYGEDDNRWSVWNCSCSLIKHA